MKNNINNINKLRIQELLNYTVKATNDLSNIAYSLRNTEDAYNRFIANNLRNSINNANLNLVVQEETGVEISSPNRTIGLIDITINSFKDNRIIVACEAVRLSHFNKQILKNHLSRLQKYFNSNASAYFFIIYNENNNFSETLNKYKEILKQTNYTIQKSSYTTDFQNINVIKTRYLKENIYHIFVSLNQEKEEIITGKKIKNITITNFKLFENINVQLSPNVNILLGKNAFGKTSFLQALALVNIPDNNTDINNYQGIIRQKYHEAEISIEREGEPSTTINITNTGKTTSNLKLNIHEPIFLAYGTNLFSRYTDHNYSKLINELINGSQKWYFTQSIFQDTTTSFYDPLGILNTLNETKGEKSKQIKMFILSAFKKLLPEEFKISLDLENKISYFFVDGNNNYLKTEQLSEGYKNNILLLTDIIVRIISINQEKKLEKDIFSVFQDTKGIICIDEFDRHMHPSWQISYVENLCKFLPKIQFVLTTHNPISILGRNESEIQVFYRDKENEINIKQLPETLTTDAGTVLLTHFDMISILSINLQQKIDKFYELKTIKNLSNSQQKDLLNLEKTLNDTFVGINIHDFRFLKFLKFLKENNFDHRERHEELVISEEDVNNFRKEFKEYYK